MKVTFPFGLFHSVSLAMLVLHLSACGGGGGTEDAAPSPPAVGFEEITVSALGGEYELANGIGLSIPPGAVVQDTTIALRRVATDELVDILNTYGEKEKILLAAVQSSSGVTFLQPITLSLPLETTLSPSALPFLMVVDTRNGTYAFDVSQPTASTATAANSLVGGRFAVTASLGSLGAKYVQYDCGNNRVIIANIDELPELDRALAAVAIQKLRAESDCFENPCRCCGIRVQEEGLDISEIGGNGEQLCYNASIKGTVQYLSCGDGQLTESYELSESSVGAVNLTPNALEMEPASGAVVSVNVVDAEGTELEEYNIVDVPSDNPDVASKGFIEIDQDRFEVLAHKPGQANLMVTLQCAITAGLPVTVKKIPIMTDQDQLVVPEGENASFHVWLGAPPPQDTVIQLSVSHGGGDLDLVLFEGFELFFNELNWNLPQQVVLSGLEDDDVDNGSASISLSSASGLLDDRELLATEVDNDLLQFVTSSSGIPVPEGGKASFSVRLSNEPPDTVAVSVTHVFGDADISVGTGASLSFGASDWNTPKAVVLFAAEDDEDTVNGVATIRVSDNAGQLSSVDIAATEVDNDILELTVTPSELCIERNRTANFSVIGSTAIDFNQLQWKSSDLTVATVDQTGNVTAQGDGPAEIAAEYLVDGQVVAAAFSRIQVQNHCVAIRSPVYPAQSCIHAVDNLVFEPTNDWIQLDAIVKTALAGHALIWSTTDGSTIAVDSTGFVRGRAGGVGTVDLLVDNVVTEYKASLPVRVVSLPSDYEGVGLNLTFDPANGPALMNSREIVPGAQLRATLTEEVNRCNVATDAMLDRMTVTNWHESGKVIGQYMHETKSETLGFVFDINSCSLEFFLAPILGVPQGDLYVNETYPSSINAEGTIVGWAHWMEYDYNWCEINPDWVCVYEVTTAFVYENGTFSFPFFDYDLDPRLGLQPQTTLHAMNNNRAALMSVITAGGQFDEGLYYLDTPVGQNNPLRLNIDGSETLNDHEHVVGNSSTPWFYSQGIHVDLTPTFAGGVGPAFLFPKQINNSEDILAIGTDGVSMAEYYLLYLCPLPVESPNALFVQDRSVLEGYEPLETSCDGRDNDLDGNIDVPLVAQLTTKQAGVCAGLVKECKGGLGWVDNYNLRADYEFPEISCDGKDNDCDGVPDEGCTIP